MAPEETPLYPGGPGLKTRSAYYLAITYLPKWEGVRSGEIRQTIRPRRNLAYMPSRPVTIYNWECKTCGDTYESRGPMDLVCSVCGLHKSFRHSCWGTRVHARITRVIPVFLYSSGVQLINGWRIIPWDQLDRLARLDGISDGSTMGALFNSHYDLPSEGAPFQIIRWGEITVDERVRPTVPQSGGSSAET